MKKTGTYVLFSVFNSVRNGTRGSYGINVVVCQRITCICECKKIVGYRCGRDGGVLWWKKILGIMCDFSVHLSACGTKRLGGTNQHSDGKDRQNRIPRSGRYCYPENAKRRRRLPNRGRGKRPHNATGGTASTKGLYYLNNIHDISPLRAFVTCTLVDSMTVAFSTEP